MFGQQHVLGKKIKKLLIEPLKSGLFVPIFFEISQIELLI